MNHLKPGHQRETTENTADALEASGFFATVALLQPVNNSELPDQIMVKDLHGQTWVVTVELLART